MKTEFIDVNETRKNLVVEIPPDVVDAEIDRVAARLLAHGARARASARARCRPRVIKQRFKDQILHDVAHDLIPRAVDDGAARARPRAGRHARHPRRRRRGGPAADLPARLRDGAAVRAGRLHGPDAAQAAGGARGRRRRPGARAAARARGALRAGRGPAGGRGRHGAGRSRRARAAGSSAGRRGDADGATTRAGALQNVSIELGATANPPGLRRAAARRVGRRRRATFTVDVPGRLRRSPELAGATVDYTVTVKGIRRKVLPALDDEFAKDLGDFETLDALRDARARGPGARGRARRRARGAARRC